MHQDKIVKIKNKIMLPCLTLVTQDIKLKNWNKVKYMSSLCWGCEYDKLTTVYTSEE